MEKIYKDNEFMEYPKEKKVYSSSVEIKPTVKAIPIKWVIELSNKLKNDEDDFEKAMFLLDLVDLWEKENGLS